MWRAFHDTCQKLRMSFFWSEQFQLLNVLLSFIECNPNFIGTCSLWFIIWVWVTVFIVNKNVLEGLFPVDQVVVVGLYTSLLTILWRLQPSPVDVLTVRGGCRHLRCRCYFLMAVYPLCRTHTFQNTSLDTGACNVIPCAINPVHGIQYSEHEQVCPAQRVVLHFWDYALGLLFVEQFQSLNNSLVHWLNNRCTIGRQLHYLTFAKSSSWCKLALSMNRRIFLFWRLIFSSPELLWPAVRHPLAVNFFYLNIFSLETAHWILIKLHRNGPWVVPY